MIWTRQPSQTRMYENGMPSFDFQKHAKEVNAAHDELHAAFALVANRNDEDDPRTKRWRTAINAFRAALARAYPEALRQVADGKSPASELSTNMMLDFIEADPVFYRSGYLKEKVLRQLKKQEFSEEEAERLRRSILAVVLHTGGRREFLYYCRAAPQVASDAFRRNLETLERSDDAGVRLRANWVLAGLQGRWLDLKRAARALHRRGAGSALIARAEIG